MKRLEEFAPEELLALTEDQVYSLIDVECANNGAPIAGVVPTMPEPCEGKPDVTAYKVTTPDLYFATMAQATAVVNFLVEQNILKQVSFKGQYSWQGPHQLITSDVDSTVAQEKFWTPDHHAKHKRDIERYKQQKKDYDTEMKEHQSAISSRSDIEDDVWRRVREAQTTASDQEKLRSLFLEYCKIADGDRQTALSFLLKATPHNEEFVRTTLNMELPTEEEHGDEEEQERSDEDGS